MNQWIDVHAHLNMLEAPPEETLQACLASGVERVVTIGTCADDHPVVVELAKKLQPHVYCTLGVHPHDAADYTDAVETFMRSHLNDPEVVAVAEIGLDYYYDHSPRDQQKQIFRRQLELAREFGLPVEIHTRDAEPDTIDILKPFAGQVSGLIHCFTGTQWLADHALSLGFDISFSGIVTFKNADELRKVVKSVPLDRLHVETDAPFLTHVPFRGKKNSPEYVVHVAEKVAEIKGVTMAELAAQTKANAKKMFPKIKWDS